MNLQMRYAYFPKPLHDVVGKLVPNKESIASWLWAKQRLLGWRLDIRWLWRSPAGLFGIDQTGSLIIVRISDGTAANPFEKSAADIKSAGMNRSWSAHALRAKWLEYASGTRIGCYRPDYGIVERYLKLRERSGNPFPVFFYLIAPSRSDFGLSRRARKTLEAIQKQVGDERAGVRAISASIGAIAMRVQCWTPFD